MILGTTTDASVKKMRWCLEKPLDRDRQSAVYDEAFLIRSSVSHEIKNSNLERQNFETKTKLPPGHVTEINVFAIM